MLVLPVQIQSVFDTMISGASGIASDVLTVVIGSLSILLIIYGLHMLIKIIIPERIDDSNQNKEDDKHHV